MQNLISTLKFKILSLRWALPGLLLLSSLNVMAQYKVQAQIDSLHRKLVTAKEDTNKVNLFVSLGDVFVNPMKVDSVLFYYHRSLELSTRLKWETGIARSYGYLGYAYYFKPDYVKCQDYSQRSVALTFKIGDYQQAVYALYSLSRVITKRKNIAAAIAYLQSLERRFTGHRRQLAGLYMLLGNCEQERSGYPAALDYYDKSFALEDADHRQYIESEQLFSIAQFYNRLGYTKKERAALVKAAANFQKSGDERSQFDLAFCYFYLGGCADQEGDRLTAIAWYIKTIRITEKINKPSLWGSAENNIGSDYFLMKDYDKAYTYTTRAIALEKNDSTDLFSSLGTLGSIYREAPEPVLKKAGITPGEQYERSAALLNQAVNYQEKHNNPTYGVDDDNLNELSLTYEKMHRYGDALKTYRAYVAKKKHNDSLTDEKAVALKEAQIGYSHKEDSLRYKQNITNEQLKAKKLQSYFFIGGIASLLLLSLFIWRNYNNQRKSNKLLADANHLLGEQREEITAQRDQLSNTITDLKSAQTQLIQSEKMASLGELTAGIAHEIQNPLNFVNNFSEVNTELIDELQEEVDKGNYDEVKAIAGDIKENQLKISQHGKRADFIVKGMLQHSRSHSGERQLTNINALADEFFKLSYHGLRAKDKNFNAEMTTHFNENLPATNMVQQDIGRVLLNLFNNAFYAVNQKAKTVGLVYKPEVTVSTAYEAGQVIIKVTDNGVGIPEAIKVKIMQPFFTTKPTGEGTGLGLSLTYDMVVKGHGGTIKVESKEGEGSEFEISLPAS